MSKLDELTSSIFGQFEALEAIQDSTIQAQKDSLDIINQQKDAIHNQLVIQDSLKKEGKTPMNIGVAEKLPWGSREAKDLVMKYDNIKKVLANISLKESEIYSLKLAFGEIPDSLSYEDISDYQDQYSKLTVDLQQQNMKLLQLKEFGEQAGLSTHPNTDFGKKVREFRIDNILPLEMRLQKNVKYGDPVNHALAGDLRPGTFGYQPELEDIFYINTPKDFLLGDTFLSIHQRIGPLVQELKGYEDRFNRIALGKIQEL